MINYTFIIPHKNIPDLLKRCIDSIPRREDIEIIIVDDNSAPHIVNSEKFPGINDPYVKIIYTKEGKGAGYARNVGIKEAKGKWILFTDADDYYGEDVLDAMDTYLSSQEEIVYFDYNTVFSDTLEPAPPRLLHYKEFLLTQNFESLRYASYTPWPKMVARKLIERHHLQFDETPVCNDIMFSAYAGHYAKTIAISTKPVYYATVRSDSLWHGATFNSLLTRIKVSCRYTRFVKQLGLSHFRIYSYGFVEKCKSFGKKAYYRALWEYIKNEPLEFIYLDLSLLLKAKFCK